MSRFTLEAGRRITDTKTGDTFRLQGCEANGGRAYDPARLDAIAHKIVALLNEADGLSMRDVGLAIDLWKSGMEGGN